jgi:hypothetical protein
MANNTSLYGSNGNVLPAGDNVIITGTLTVNGCSILTDCSAFNLFPQNANTLNIGLESTTLALGATSGVTTIRNQLATANYDFPVSDGTANQVLITDGAGNLSFANVQSLDTNYNIQADTATGGANLTLVGSDATTDSVKFANGTNVTVSRTDASTITISSIDTNTTYTQNASATTGGANLNLVGSDATTDTIKFAQGVGITVVRTDADTITITNTDPGSAGVTSITGTANQVIASSPTGAVTLSLPQSIATTSSPQFADVTGGNIIVGGLTDNTISSADTNGDIILQPNGNGDVSIVADTLFIGDGGQPAFITTNGTGTLYINTNNGTNTGSIFIETGVNGNIVLEPYAGGTGAVKTYNDFVVDDDVLFVDVSTKRIGINNTSPQYELHIDQGADALTQFAMTTNERTMILTMNDGDDLLSLSYGATPGATNRLQFSPTDQWFNSGNLGVGTATPAYALDVSGTGRFTSNLIATGGFTLNGTTSGYSDIIQPAVGANIQYVLPAAQGAVSTVLTNDGSGNLSWALPGGGGSTFGNITVGVVTDNTISTTTGDLVLASATNVIDATSAIIDASGYSVDGKGTIDSQTTTTTSTALTTINNTTRNGLKCLISVVDNVTGARHILEALLLEQGTNAYITTYAEIYSSVALATFSAVISAGNLTLQATPASANSTTFTVIRTSIN